MGRLFELFHGAEPRIREIEFTPPKEGSRLIKIGRLWSIIYECEEPSKHAGKLFEHKWGDTGGRMRKHRPLLVCDESGKHFYIVNDKARPHFNERGIIG